MNSNSQDLFEQLYSRYYKMVYRYILSQVKDTWNAEDILSEVFMKIYRHKNEIVAIDKSSSWLIKIARNSIIDFYRKNSKMEPEENIELEPYYESGYENIFIHDEFIEITKNLTPEVRHFLTMRYSNNLKFREIASLMNLSESLAKKRVYSALKMAKESCAYL